MNLEEIRNKKARFVIGLMSGTSCDGVDAVLVRIKGTGPGLAMKLIAHQTFPYKDEELIRMWVADMERAHRGALSARLRRRSRGYVTGG